MFKRVDALSPLERAIDELTKLRARLAEESITPADQTLYGYGHSCGMRQAIDMARSILEHCLNEGDPDFSERRDER